MNRIHKLMKAAALALALSAGLMLSSEALAGDTVTLKDGRVLQGEIIREVEGIIWLKFTLAGVEQIQMFQPGEIAKIERDAAKPDAAPSEPQAPAQPASADDAARIASRTPMGMVITMGDNRVGRDMVGIYMTQHALKQMIPIIEGEMGNSRTAGGDRVVVLRFASGGGYTLEVPRMSDTLHEEYKPRFRTVAWIDSAISAAAMTAHNLEEIYFTPQGNYGGATQWSGDLVASKGRSLEEVLFRAEKISARGGHDPLIMRAMQIFQPLSATIDDTGRIRFFPDLSGEIMVNRENEILTLNEATAKRIQLSRGTASTVEELARLMNYQEFQWVGTQERNIPWPVSRAERWNLRYREQVARDEDNFNRYVASYQMNIQAAQQEPVETRGRFVNRAREALNQIKAMIRNNPNFQLFTLGMFDAQYAEWLEQQERLLRDLMRR
jgi:hypothetical protein